MTLTHVHALYFINDVICIQWPPMLPPGHGVRLFSIMIELTPRGRKLVAVLMGEFSRSSISGGFREAVGPRPPAISGHAKGWMCCYKTH